MDKERREIKVLKKDVLNIYDMNIDLIISGEQQHIFARMRKYHIDDIDNIFDIVIQGVEKYLLNNIGRIDSNFVYIIDKQSCICIPCNIDDSKREGYARQRILIKTVFKITSKSGSLPTGIIVYLNEDNPSDEWEVAINDMENYRATYTIGGSASIPNPDEFVSRNYNWKPNKNKGEVMGDPLSYKAYDKLGDSENMNVHRALVNRLIDTHQKAKDRRSAEHREYSLNKAFDNMEKYNKQRDVMDKVHAAWYNKDLLNAEKGPIRGINKDLRDYDKMKRKQYNDVLNMSDNEPIPNLNQDLRDIDNIRRKQNECITLNCNDLKYIILESIKRIQKKRD